VFTEIFNLNLNVVRSKQTVVVESYHLGKIKISRLCRIQQVFRLFARFTVEQFLKHFWNVYVVPIMGFIFLAFVEILVEFQFQIGHYEVIFTKCIISTKTSQYINTQTDIDEQNIIHYYTVRLFESCANFTLVVDVYTINVVNNLMDRYPSVVILNARPKTRDWTILGICFDLSVDGYLIILQT